MMRYCTESEGPGTWDAPFLWRCFIWLRPRRSRVFMWYLHNKNESQVGAVAETRPSRELLPAVILFGAAQTIHKAVSCLHRPPNHPATQPPVVRCLPWSMTHIYDYFHDAFGAEPLPFRTMRKVEKYEKGSAKAKNASAGAWPTAVFLFVYTHCVLTEGVKERQRDRERETHIEKKNQ